MTAQLLALPTPDDRKERHLRAAWAEVDRLEAKLREARAHARKLEQQVGRAMGYVFPPGREKLEAGLKAKDMLAERARNDIAG